MSEMIISGNKLCAVHINARPNEITIAVTMQGYSKATTAASIFTPEEALNVVDLLIEKIEEAHVSDNN